MTDTLLAIALAAIVGAVLLLFILPLIPGFIDALVNKPNLYRPEGEKELTYPESTFGFFTYLQPGRVKMIERGERFVRAVMKFDGHMFLGEQHENAYEPDDAEYWEVVKAPPAYRDAHPLPPPWRKRGAFFFAWLLYSPISVVWWLWKRWVYFITGGVFTGVWPFQQVRTYPMARFKKIPLESGVIHLDRVEDWSDHYRVADFLYPADIPRADTKDKIPVNIELDVVAQVLNPYKTAYNTDNDWPTRLLTSIADGVTTYTRATALDEVLSASNPAEARQLANVIKEVGAEHADPEKQGPTRDFGITIKRVQVIDISPVSEEHARKLGDVAIARVDRKAREERAIGEAAPIRESGKALREFPEALVIPQIEGNVRTAQAAGDKAIVFLGTNSQPTDPTLAAILRELRDKRTGTGP
jgi:regulator of protease activity HflC (stomatin/prohibitin superfamily)